MGCLMKCVLSTILSLTAAMLAACSNSSTSSAEEPSTMLDSSSSEELSSSDEKYIVDGRDGQKYRIVTIGSQTWMAENLNFKTEKCHCYNDVDSNCTKYGRLYTWADAMDSAGVFSSTGKGCGYTGCFVSYPVRGICPEDFHLPSASDWGTLIAAVGGRDVAGKMLKSASDWDGSDAFSFSVLPGGYGGDFGKYYYELGKKASFWSSNAGYSETSTDVDYFSIWSGGWHGNEPNFHAKDDLRSIRCIQDDLQTKDSSAEKVYEEILIDARDGQTYKTVVIGQQTWMAENLNYKTESSFCYNDDVNNCTEYGRLYTWVSATKSDCQYGDSCLVPLGDVQGVCPLGWHLPSTAEWNVLFDYVDPKRDETTFYGSSDLSSLGTNSFSFSTIPAGYRTEYGTYGDGLPSDAGCEVHIDKMGWKTVFCFHPESHFWTSDAYGITLDHDNGDLRDPIHPVTSKFVGYYVRCIKD